MRARLLSASAGQILVACACLGMHAAAAQTRPVVRAETGATAVVQHVVRTNPDIDAIRQQVRVLEARVAAARSAGLPSISGNVVVQARKLDVRNGTQGDSEFVSGQASVGGRLAVFDGGRTINGIAVAEQELASGQAAFHAAVSDVLQQLLISAADVHRDQQIKLYAEQQSEAVAEQLRAIGRRYEVSEATRTDQAQARARLASVQANIAAAEEALGTSRNRWQRISGKPVSAVPPLPALAGLPATLPQAQQRALERNPRVRIAKRNAVAADFAVRVASGALLPQVDAIAGYEYLTGGVANLFTGKLPEDRSAAFGGVEMNVPLFEPRNYADLRRARGTRAQRLAQVRLTERDILEETASNWVSWQSAAESIGAAAIAVTAQERAVEGLKREWENGNRTVIEVLDAQRELLDARVVLERARRNEYVARVGVLAAMGEMKPQAILPYADERHLAGQRGRVAAR
ncbi:MAG: TolC family protein [Cypionkella sp.]